MTCLLYTSLFGTVLKHTVGKSAGRGTDIDAYLARKIETEGFNRLIKLISSAADKGLSLIHI